MASRAPSKAEATATISEQMGQAADVGVEIGIDALGEAGLDNGEEDVGFEGALNGFHAMPPFGVWMRSAASLRRARKSMALRLAGWRSKAEAISLWEAPSA